MESHCDCIAATTHQTRSDIKPKTSQKGHKSMTKTFLHFMTSLCWLHFLHYMTMYVIVTFANMRNQAVVFINRNGLLIREGVNCFESANVKLIRIH